MNDCIEPKVPTLGGLSGHYLDFTVRPVPQVLPRD